MATRDPLWLGTGLSYSPEEDRLLLSNLLGGPRATFTPSTTLGNRPGHGVVRLTDLAVTEDGTPGMRVKVAAGGAFIAGSSNAEQGSYAVRNDADLVVNLAASDATQRRNDIVVARITDADYAGATRTFTIEIKQGTLYSGAHNDANDPTLDASCLALARVQVAAADTAITNAEITDLRQFISPLSSNRRGTAAQRAAAINLENGDRWYDTDESRPYVHNGTDWAAGGMLEGGYAQVTANQGSITAEADLTGLAVTVTVATGRRIKITAHEPSVSSTVNGDTVVFYIKEGSTFLNEGAQTIGTLGLSMDASVVLAPSAGAHTYKLSMFRAAGTGTVTANAGSTRAAFIVVEDIGPV